MNNLCISIITSVPRSVQLGVRFTATQSVAAAPLLLLFGERLRTHSFPPARTRRCSYQDVARHRLMPPVLLSGLRPGADQGGDDRPEQMCDTTPLRSGWVKTQSPAVSSVLLRIPGATPASHLSVWFLPAASFLRLCLRALIIALGARNSTTITQTELS